MAKKRKSLLVPAVIAAGVLYLLTRPKTGGYKPSPGYTSTTPATTKDNPGKENIVVKAVRGQL